LSVLKVGVLRFSTEDRPRVHQNMGGLVKGKAEGATGVYVCCCFLCFCFVLFFLFFTTAVIEGKKEVEVGPNTGLKQLVVINPFVQA